MNDENEKIVNFAAYCVRCVHIEEPATSEVCDECLSIPARPYSHKPENFKEKE